MNSIPYDVNMNDAVAQIVAIRKNIKKYVFADNIVYLFGYSLTYLARIYNPMKDKVFNPDNKNSAPLENQAKIV